MFSIIAAYQLFYWYWLGKKLILKSSLEIVFKLMGDYNMPVISLNCHVFEMFIVYNSGL